MLAWNRSVTLIAGRPACEIRGSLGLCSIALPFCLVARVNRNAGQGFRPMPNPQPRQRRPRAATFRERSDDLEKRRDGLLARLGALAEKAAPHPALGRAR